MIEFNQKRVYQTYYYRHLMDEGYLRYDGLGFSSNKDQRKGYSTARVHIYNFDEIKKFARDVKENYWMESKFIMDLI